MEGRRNLPPDVTRDAATVHVEWRTADGRHEKSFVVSNPVLWSPETPQLYEVEVNGRTYRYGVRTCRFTPDDGLIFFNIARVDASGTVVEDASESVSFSVKGPGRIIAVGNGDARGYASFKATDSHPLYCGRALVIVRREGAGEISLTSE